MITIAKSKFKSTLAKQRWAALEQLLVKGYLGLGLRRRAGSDALGRRTDDVR